MIESTRKIFYQHQEHFSLLEKLFNRLPGIRGICKDHLYNKQRQASGLLLDHGQVVMACVVEADTALHNPGHNIGEAYVVYSTDELFEQMPSLLANVAVTVTSIRDNEGLSEEYTHLVDVLDAKTEQQLCVPIPKDICYQKDVYLSAIYVNPAHLPLPMIYRGFFPILICPKQTPHIMVLPRHYWSKELLEAWLENKSDA